MAPLLRGLVLQARNGLIQHQASTLSAACADALGLATRGEGAGSGAPAPPVSERAFSSGGSGGSDGEFIGMYTPITKRLWAQRLQWHTGAHAGGDAAAAPGGGALQPRAPEATALTYPFTRDSALLEAYANPWRGVRVGRLLEDLDSLAGSGGRVWGGGNLSRGGTRLGGKGDRSGVGASGGRRIAAGVERA